MADYKKMADYYQKVIDDPTADADHRQEARNLLRKLATQTHGSQPGPQPGEKPEPAWKRASDTLTAMDQHSINVARLKATEQLLGSQTMRADARAKDPAAAREIYGEPIKQPVSDGAFPVPYFPHPQYPGGDKGTIRDMAMLGDPEATTVMKQQEEAESVSANQLGMMMAAPGMALGAAGLAGPLSSAVIEGFGAGAGAGMGPGLISGAPIEETLGEGMRGGVAGGLIGGATSFPGAMYSRLRNHPELGDLYERAMTPGTGGKTSVIGGLRPPTVLAGKPAGEMGPKVIVRDRMDKFMVRMNEMGTEARKTGGEARTTFFKSPEAKDPRTTEDLLDVIDQKLADNIDPMSGEPLNDALNRELTNFRKKIPERPLDDIAAEKGMSAKAAVQGTPTVPPVDYSDGNKTLRLPLEERQTLQFDVGGSPTVGPEGWKTLVDPDDLGNTIPQDAYAGRLGGKTAQFDVGGSPTLPPEAYGPGTKTAQFDVGGADTLGPVAWPGARTLRVDPEMAKTLPPEAYAGRSPTVRLDVGGAPTIPPEGYAGGSKTLIDPRVARTQVDPEGWRTLVDPPGVPGGEMARAEEGGFRGAKTAQIPPQRMSKLAAEYEKGYEIARADPPPGTSSRKWGVTARQWDSYTKEIGRIAKWGATNKDSQVAEAAQEIGAALMEGRKHWPGYDSMMKKIETETGMINGMAKQLGIPARKLKLPASQYAGPEGPREEMIGRFAQAGHAGMRTEQPEVAEFLRRNPDLKKDWEEIVAANAYQEISGGATRGGIYMSPSEAGAGLRGFMRAEKPLRERLDPIFGALRHPMQVMRTPAAIGGSEGLGNAAGESAASVQDQARAMAEDVNLLREYLLSRPEYIPAVQTEEQP
jgi:hypothetical protein